MPDRELILLSNDDSIFSAGIRKLAKALHNAGKEVVVVAPLTEQSAKSHGLTLDRPLRIHELGRLDDTDVTLFGVDGTPADTIYVALVRAGFLARKPSLVVSGINHGYNLGSDTFYSGTVAAAREGALRGHPSVAFSAGPGTPMELCAEWAVRILEQVPRNRVALYSVNFPASREQFLGVRACRLGQRSYTDDVEVRQDPRGREYLWIGGSGTTHGMVSESDTEACDAGFVSITPLCLDQTHQAEVERCAIWANISASKL